MYVDLDLTNSKYENLRDHNENLFGEKLYPTYLEIAEMKKKCYPDHIEISDRGAKVEIFALLEHTTKRILKLINKSILDNFKNLKLTLLGKWGMDGVSGQQTTRQKWFGKLQQNEEVSNNNNNNSDNTIFLVTFSPLQLRAGDNILWQNDRPNSTFYCRTIEFIFDSESDMLVKNTYDFYEKQLNKVKTYCFEFENMSIQINFDLRHTMINGKIHNILSAQRASNSCNICRVGPKNVNDIPYGTKLLCKREFYKFGLASLHCWIRTMEYILHISYKNQRIRKLKLQKKKKK